MSLTAPQELFGSSHQDHGPNYNSENVELQDANETSNMLDEETIEKLRKYKADYIIGSVIKKLKQSGWCQSCIVKCTEGGQRSGSFQEDKAYKAGCLGDPSPALSDFVVLLDRDYDSMTAKSFPLPHPRTAVRNHFFAGLAAKKYDLNGLNCEENHKDDLVEKLVFMYLNISIFRSVTIFNRNLSKNKKGRELNKMKKLNQ